MGRLKRVSVSDTFPFGRQKIGKIASSTGIYGKHAGGQRNNRAVKVRRGGNNG